LHSREPKSDLTGRKGEEGSEVLREKEERGEERRGEERGSFVDKRLDAEVRE